MGNNEAISWERLGSGLGKAMVVDEYLTTPKLQFLIVSKP
jgi:hypothetical protein